MAINLPMVHEVKSIPHVDGMNIAFGPCAIMPFGEPASIFFFVQLLIPISISGFFASGVRAWFVNQPLFDFTGPYGGLDVYTFNSNHSLQH